MSGAWFLVPGSATNHETRGTTHGVAQRSGQIAGVLVSTKDPETVLILKGESPLEFRWHERMRVVAYASNGALLDAAVSEDPSWKLLEIPAMTLAVFRAGSVQSPELSPLEFSIAHGNARAKRPEKCATYDFERWVPHWISRAERTQNGQTAWTTSEDTVERQ